MRYLQITLCVMLLFISSCRNKSLNINTYNPDVSDLKEMVRIDNKNPLIITPEKAIETDLFEDENLFICHQRIVPLDNKKGHIGNISKVMVHKDKIYIVDEAKNNECIFVYDTLGHSINKIDKRGKGPGEYIAIQSVMIDSINNRIVLQDQLQSQVLFYDLDGNFLHKERLSFNIVGMSLLGQNYFFSTNYGQNIEKSVFDNYSFFTGTIDKVQYYSFVRQSCEKNMWVTSLLEKNYNNDLLYKPNFSDTIYHILSDSTYMLYSIFKFKNSMFEECSRYDDLSMSKVDDFVRDYDNLSSLKFYDSKDYLFYRCSIAQHSRNFIYSKQEKLSYEIKFDGFYGNINDIKYIFEMPCASIDDEVISIAQPYEIIQKFTDFKPYMDNPSEVPINKLIKSISKSDNPLLVFSKFAFN